MNIISYNAKGFKPRNYDYIEYLFKQCQILLIQETWLYEFQSNIITKVLNDCLYYTVSTMNSNDIGRQGRPYGGLAIVWHKCLPFNILPIKTDNKRIACVTVTTDIIKLILINVYMPQNNNSQQSYEEFGDVLDEISSLIRTYANYNCLIGGDINIDFNKNNSLNITLMKRFLEIESLLCSNLKFKLKDLFTYESFDGSRSTIDHFIYNEPLKIIQYDILVHGNNLSDHNPIYINIECNYMKIERNIKSMNDHEIKINWNKVESGDIALYKEILDVHLNNIQVSDELISCVDLNCKAHSDEMFRFFNDINDAITMASDFALPKSKVELEINDKKKGIMPGWNKYVKPVKDYSVLLTELWKNQGCKLGDDLDKDRKLARSYYHKAIKFVKSNRDEIIKENIANKLCNNNFAEFWKEIRKLKNNNNINYPNVVDNVHGDENICSLFHDKYKNLFNCYSDNKMSKISMHISDKIDKVCKIGLCGFSHYVTKEQIKLALKKLKCNKSDEIFDISSNNLINGTDKLNDYISKLFNMFLTHGFSTHKFNRSIIVPLPKNNKKSLCTSDNYRGISLNVVLCKLLEYVITDVIGEFIKSSDHQFGYKNNLSTNICTFVTVQTINYYLNGKSSVYTLFLDALKAFNKVKHDKLLDILINSDICPVFLKLIAAMYRNNNAQVIWNNISYPLLDMTNGVKQGEVHANPLFV